MKRNGVDARESGMALVFAIGLLALMLAVGLAFVGNSIIFKKVAVNNSSRTQARMLALSAANRAATAVMMYQQDIVDAGVNFPENFDMIYSYGKYDQDDGSHKNETGTGAEFSDGLLKKDKSVSAMLLPEDGSVVDKEFAKKFNVPFKTATNSEKWPGRWVFFYDKTGESGSSRRIVGRAAWQVVTSSAQILAPVFFRGKEKKTDPADDDFVPRDRRWGREIDEVYLDNRTEVFRELYNNFPPDGDKVSSYDEIFTLMNISDAEKQNWVQKWLIPDMESSATIFEPTTISPEVYYYKPAGSKRRHQFLRFNISELTNAGDVRSWTSKYSGGSDRWYARFGSVEANSLNAIRKLTADSTTFSSSDQENYDYEISASDRSGLPFLRRVGHSDDPHSFYDGSGTAQIANWRRQIAANFNDYCDPDSIPTSDVKASEWSVTDSAKFPGYTGNEKTLYLNEAVVGIGGLEVTLDTTSQGNVLTGYKPAVTEIKARLLAELVKIYDGSDELLNPANLQAQFGLKKLRFKISLLVDVAGEISCTQKDSGGTVINNDYTKDFSVVVNPDHTDDNAKATVEYAPTVPAAVTVGGFDALANGYSVGQSELFSIKEGITDTAYSNYIETQIKNAATAAVPPSGGGSTYEFNGLRITRLKIGYKLELDENSKLELLPMLLKSGAGGVDFVRFDRTGEMKLLGTVEAVDRVEFGKSGDAYVKADAFPEVYLIGGMEARDPRQNLNPYYADPLKSDWDLAPTLSRAAAAAAGGGATPSLNILENAADPMWPFRFTGARNRKSAPNAPGYYNTDGTDGGALDAAGCDEEAAADPAWLGNNANEHISTAFIRNAPMMSPWEIGAIHRGVRWQTLNIKTSGQPGGGAFSQAAFAPHGDDGSGSDADSKWELAGTKYSEGDGGILEQIKMTDRLASYGRFNVNLLNTAHSEYKPELDPDMVRALFNKIRYRQSLGDFITESTRTGNKFPTSGVTGTELDVSTGTVGGMTGTAGRPADGFTCRAEYLNFDNGGGLETAFGAVSGQNTDAAQEEIIGKTVNLLTAGTTSPAVVQVVVVAQSIRDLSGTQVKATSESSRNKFSDPNGGTVPEIEDGTVAMDCKTGRFDMLEHDDDSDRNVYFDEITGEVKMLVTMDRDPLTGRMKIRQIDYLSD